MLKGVFIAALALASACAPAHRVAHPRETTPEWAVEADFALVCVAGAATAGTFNTGSALFLPSLATFVGLIALDTWAAR